MILAVARWSALRVVPAGMVQEGVGALVMVEAVAMVMTVWEVRRVERVVVIVVTLRKVRSRLRFLYWITALTGRVSMFPSSQRVELQLK
jgi:hypothetical protein